VIQYQNILAEIIKDGVWQDNRTNYRAKFIPSATIKHDLRDGFPVLTTKKLFFKQSIAEILGFIRGYTNASDFRSLGCRFWDSDANENKTWLNSPFRKGEDDLGCVYGSTWRDRESFVRVITADHRAFYQDRGYVFIGYDKNGSVLSRHIDQLSDCIHSILYTPTDRRNIMHAWFPELFPQMALPPCHVMYEFVPDEQHKVLHMTMTQRSCDTLLGVPMNLFGSALLLAIVSKVTGYTAGVFTHHMTNAHLYENQIEAAKIQISRSPFESPMLVISNAEGTDPIQIMENLKVDDFKINGYAHHEALPKVDMAQEK